MKQCPQCGVTYADALQYCTTDGAPLAPMPDPVPAAAPLVGAPRRGIGTAVWVGLGLAGLALAVAVGVWIGAAGDDPGLRQRPTKPPVVQNGGADDGAEDDGGDEADEPEPADESASLPQLVVNSPRDGFLAIRSEPSVRQGRRIGEALHGQRISVLSATGPRQTIGGRTGQWVYIRHDGLEGWVFDAFTVPLAN